MPMFKPVSTFEFGGKKIETNVKAEVPLAAPSGGVFFAQAKPTNDSVFSRLVSAPVEAPKQEVKPVT